MKWVVFVAVVLAIVPFAEWLRRNPREISKVWMFVGFLPFGLTIMPAFNISVISWPEWPGYVKGIQFSALDACAISMYLALPSNRQQPVPFRFALALYFIAAVISMVLSAVPVAASFYVWQLARMFLLYVVIVRACADERVPVALLTGMAIGLVYQLGMVGWQRFGLGAIQSAGTFGHQNSLGLASHFVVFPLFALLLAGRRGWQFIAGPACGLVIAILTVSRATIGLAGVGLGVLFALSALRQWTSRKAQVAMLGAITVALLIPVALSSYERRFGTEPVAEEDGYDERAAFTRAAFMISADYPMGVGANTYIVVANSGGYQARAGVTWWGGSRATSVHNVYWLTLAEMGYFGLLALCIFLLQVIFVAFRSGWRHRNDVRGDLLLGLGVGVTVAAIHSYFEWALLLAPIQYLFIFSTGLIGGLSQQLAVRQNAPQPQVSPARFSFGRHE